MVDERFRDAVEWNPVLTDERKARVASYREKFAKSASAFRVTRNELGLSQVAAAIKLGTTQANISKIEKRASLEIGQLEKLTADTDYEVIVILRNKNDKKEVVLTV